MPKEMVRREPLDVFSPFFNFSRTFDRAVESLQADRGQRAIVPAMDVVEAEDHLLITAELPGMKKDAVKITIENGVLAISGEKKTESDEEKKGFHLMERRFGSFHRTVTLPRKLDAGKAEASFEDGVLAIRIPRSEEAKPRELDIK